MTRAMSRRTFVQATAGAVWAAHGVGVWSQEPAAEVPRPLRVAVMGVNNRGFHLALAFCERPAVTVTRICDVDSRALEKAVREVSAKQGTAPQGTADFRHALDDPEVDILIVATPNHWHVPATILGVSAGKHVYVEKPCSHTAQEGEWAVAAARRHNKVVTTGTQRRSWGPIRAAMDCLRAGEIGEVRYARSWYRSRRTSIGHGTQGDPPAWLDYELWQGPAPRRPYRDNLIHYNWHWHWHWGNGELGNNGVHALDLARWGLGVDFPTRVTSAGGHYRFDDDQETPDTHMVAFEFGARAITWEGVSWSPWGPGGSAFGVTFHGDTGTMELFDVGYRVYDLQNKMVREVSGGSAESDHVDDFLRCVRTGGVPNADIEIGHRSALLCHLGNMAHRTGQVLSVDPQNGHILQADPAVTALWGREYAPGWQPQV